MPRKKRLPNRAPLGLNDAEVFCVVAADPTDQVRAREALEKARDHLEERVTERTAALQAEISERARTEEALRATEARFRSVLENSRDVIYRLSLQTGRYEYVSPSAEAVTGFSPDELISLSAEEARAMIHPDDLHATLKELAHLEETGQAEAQYRQRTKSGAYRWVSNQMSLTRDGDGRPLYRDGNIRDITAQKRAEEGLRRSRDELELRVEERTVELQKAYGKLKEETEERASAESQLRQAQKMEALGILSGGIAHDFNNILAAIIGFTELIAGHTPPGGRDERHMRRVMEAGMRGRDLVRQMLTFSRKSEQVKNHVQLSSIVKETVQFLRASMPTTIDIKVDVKSGSTTIFADPGQIQQVLMNLCTNAAFAMRERGGVLHIGLADRNVSPSDKDTRGIEPGPYVELSVRDTGIGISPENVDKIFDPFFTTKGPGEGTGLGLSVVHGIVNQHDAYIDVVSEPGKGSTFTVCFPKTTERSAAPDVSRGPIPTGSERILFIDDEEALVEIGEELLAKLGYAVVSRTSSKEALDLVRADPQRFDLVITDQTMPEMTGVELAAELLALRADMPIIMCTGFSHLVNSEGSKAAGIKAFAMKPLTTREIAKTIRDVLDG